jgi:hypothetical protein
MNRFMPVAAALLICGAAEAAPEVGKATAITTEVKGDTAGSVRTLQSGDQVFQDERIETNDKGVGQFEFLDDTKLAIGPGSVVKLDQFVYGADKSATTVTIQLTKGAFRFISGKSTHTAYKIQTPTATIGVRGTAFDVFVGGDGEMAVAMINGGVDVCAVRRTGCRRHNVVGRFLHLTPAGVISIRNRWDGTFLRTVAFAAAMPFIARPDTLIGGFRFGNEISSRYLSLVPQNLLFAPAGIPGGIVPSIVPSIIPNILPNLGPAPSRGQKRQPKSKFQLPNLFR